MAAISGITGSVTYASGFVTGAYAWSARTIGQILDITTFSPTSDYTMADAGLLDWQGSYRCRAISTADTTVSLDSGAGYVTNAFAYNVNIACEALPTTPFTAVYATRMAGLLSASGTLECYCDSTTALSPGGTEGTLTFTFASGVTATIPLIAEAYDIGVSVDGSQRHVRMNFQNSANITSAGSPPLPATTGAATFVAVTGRQLAGSILVTGCRASKAADRTQGEYEITWVGAATCTPA